MHIYFDKNSKCFWQQRRNLASLLMRPIAGWLWTCRSAEKILKPGSLPTQRLRNVLAESQAAEREPLWVSNLPLHCQYKTCLQVLVLMMKSKKSLKLGSTLLGLTDVLFWQNTVNVDVLHTLSSRLFRGNFAHAQWMFSVKVAMPVKAWWYNCKAGGFGRINSRSGIPLHIFDGN